MNKLVKLRHADGSISDFMSLERAGFIRAFTLSGERPKIVEEATCNNCNKCKEMNCNSKACEKYYSQFATKFL